MHERAPFLTGSRPSADPERTPKPRKAIHLPSSPRHRAPTGERNPALAVRAIPAIGGNPRTTSSARPVPPPPAAGRNRKLGPTTRPRTREIRRPGPEPEFDSVLGRTGPRSRVWLSTLVAAKLLRAALANERAVESTAYALDDAQWDHAAECGHAMPKPARAFPGIGSGVNALFPFMASPGRRAPGVAAERRGRDDRGRAGPTRARRDPVRHARRSRNGRERARRAGADKGPGRARNRISGYKAPGAARPSGRSRPLPSAPCSRTPVATPAGPGYRGGPPSRPGDCASPEAKGQADVTLTVLTVKQAHCGGSPVRRRAGLWERARAQV